MPSCYEPTNPSPIHYYPEVHVIEPYPPTNHTASTISSMTDSGNFYETMKTQNPSLSPLSMTNHHPSLFMTWFSRQLVNSCRMCCSSTTSKILLQSNSASRRATETAKRHPVLRSLDHYFTSFLLASKYSNNHGTLPTHKDVPCKCFSIEKTRLSLSLTLSSCTTSNATPLNYSLLLIKNSFLGRLYTLAKHVPVSYLTSTVRH